ncbi:hypothetical protein FHP05_12545 [Cerasibacillus terrae]|uniref:Uncharacterized protein n=1 Tax=Cerasibacillus terrae TaxID=2498845 RepID=A0A5C8NLD4_9BACI|nr:hypothetical protein [Cerasibacillus terrae]TXL61705.1 hypothetical protein FHP05_12545 [Cerasibacillus terrae]
MKRHMTSIFILVTAIILVFGSKLHFQWSGIVTWGLAAICLSVAAYYTKYIPSNKKQEDKKSGE